jgi:hypothetical protein
MFVSFDAPQIESWSGGVITPPERQPQRTAREEHARLLSIAAARRLRAADRMNLQRHDDAEYWKAVAPSAVHKATALRERTSFAPLPD